MRDNERTDLAVVATVAMLQEADVIRAVLQSAGIDAVVLNESTSNLLSHLSLAVNPRGIAVAVRPEDAAIAREVLQVQARQPLEMEQEPEPTPQPVERSQDISDRAVQPTRVSLSADDCALRAVWAAMFGLVCFPLAALTIYWLGRASIARRSMPPEDLSRYRRRIAIALIIGLFPAVGALGLLW